MTDCNICLSNISDNLYHFKCNQCTLSICIDCFKTYKNDTCPQCRRIFQPVIVNKYEPVVREFVNVETEQEKCKYCREMFYKNKIDSKTGACLDKCFKTRRECVICHRFQTFQDREINRVFYFKKDRTICDFCDIIF